jgi:hypothetical protein
MDNAEEGDSVVIAMNVLPVVLRHDETGTWNVSWDDDRTAIGVYRGKTQHWPSCLLFGALIACLVDAKLTTVL